MATAQLQPKLSKDETTPDQSSFFKSDSTTKRETTYFLGFEDPSSKLQELWYRWKALENWIELAIRPKKLHPDDRCVLVNDDDNDDDSHVDNLGLLKKQCLHVQGLFNDHLSTLSIETTRWASSLVARPSQINGGGMGLYYQPQSKQIVEQEKISTESSNGATNESTVDIIPSGSTVCYYTGHVHTHSSAANLTDKSYLMWIRGNTLVDPRSLMHIQARYINDPLNDTLVNCAYVPTSALQNNSNVPHEDMIRTSVVTTRDIQPGEELFVKYGDVYWDKQPIVGSRLVLNSEEKAHGKTLCDEDEKNESDSDSDLDETFPFSPLFQSKLTKPILWENDTSTTTNTR